MIKKPNNLQQNAITGIFLKSLMRKGCYSPKSRVTVLVTSLGPDPRGQTTAFRLKANPNPFMCQGLMLGVRISSAFLAMQVINTGIAYHKPGNYSSMPLEEASKGSM